MIITYLGHSCFKIQDKTTAEGLTIVTDPFDKATGYKVPNFEANLVTVSHDHHDHNNTAALRGEPFVITLPGEYDYKGIVVHGVASFHDDKKGAERGTNVIYRIEVDDISVVHLGDLNHILDNKQLEDLVGTDILLIPVGGQFTLDAKKAVEVISQIEPRIVIPMHYRLPESKIEDIDGVDKFIKELGIAAQEEERLKIAKKDLPQEDMKLVVLKCA